MDEGRVSFPTHVTPWADKEGQDQFVSSHASMISLMDLLISYLRTSVIIIKAILRSLSCVSAILKFSEPTVVLLLGSSGHM